MSSVYIANHQGWLSLAIPVWSEDKTVIFGADYHLIVAWFISNIEFIIPITPTAIGGYKCGGAVYDTNSDFWSFSHCSEIRAGRGEEALIRLWNQYLPTSKNKHPASDRVES